MIWLWLRRLSAWVELYFRCRRAFKMGQADRAAGEFSCGPFAEGLEDHEAWMYGFQGHKGFKLTWDLNCKVVK